MPDGKNDRVREVDFVRVFVDGSRDNRWVDNDRVIGGHGFTARLHAGVLRREVDPDVFVQDERYPNLTCKRAVGESVQSSRSDKENTTWPKVCGTLYPWEHLILKPSAGTKASTLTKRDMGPGCRTCFHSAISSIR